MGGSRVESGAFADSPKTTVRSRDRPGTGPGLAAPAATPPAVVQKLHDVFHKAMFSERHASALARYDQSLDYLGTRDYRQAVLATVEREKKLLARMNLLAKTAS